MDIEKSKADLYLLYEEACGNRSAFDTDDLKEAYEKLLEVLKETK